MADNVVPLPLRPPAGHRRAAPSSRRAPERLWRTAVGDEVREHRRDRGQRIVDVAGRAGVSPQYLSEIERGLKDPSSEVLAAVCGALDVSVAELTRQAGRRLDPAGTPTMSGPLCLAA